MGNSRGFLLPQGSTVCSHFFTSAQCRIPYCYTYRQLYAGAIYTCRATRLCVVTDNSCGLHLSTGFTVGCDDSAHRIYQACTIYPVGAAVGRPHNALPSRNSPFSIFNSPFVESPPQTVLEHFLYLKENHSTETILYADSQTASHKPNRAAAAPDTLRSISNTAA